MPSTKRPTAARSVTSTSAVAKRAPAAGAACAAVSLSPSARMSHVQVSAPRAASACAIARPKPCAPPVTIAVLPGNSMFMGVSPCGSVQCAGQRVEVGALHRARAVLDLVDEPDEALGDRRAQPVRRGDLGDDRDLRVDLGPALAHR